PPGLRSALPCHHNPDLLKADARRLVSFVHVADTICCQNELGFWLEARHQEINEALLTEIGLSEAKVGELLEMLPQRIEETRAIFTEHEA
ncbi:MAG TPA: hypothetical protein PKC49_10670, partial [Phycisphaerae bacterium]|nr:hypothetical protein [Phycisphaerae bacterium]